MVGGHRGGGEEAATGQRDPAQGVCVFCDGGARSSGWMMIAFIDASGEGLGIEPICRELVIALSSYR